MPHDDEAHHLNPSRHGVPASDPAPVRQPPTMPYALAPTRTPGPIDDADPVSGDDNDYSDDESDGLGVNESPMVGLRRRIATAAMLHRDDPETGDTAPSAASNDASVSVRGEITGHGFTPVYHRRMVSSLSLNASQNPQVLAASFGASFDRAGGAFPRRLSTPSDDPLVGAVTPVYRSTPVGTAIRTLSPETQARMRAAKQRAKALRASHGQSMSLSTGNPILDG